MCNIPRDVHQCLSLPPGRKKCIDCAENPPKHRLTGALETYNPVRNMPTSKAPKRAAAAAAAAAKSNSDDVITDPRFSSFATDPRFRLPSHKHTRTKIDKRFSRLLTDDDFTNNAKVDRYGRKISNASKKKALQRLYLPEDDEDEEEEESLPKIEVEDDEVVAKELRRADAGYDPARGGGFSSSEDEDEEGDEEGGAQIEEVAKFPDMREEQAGVPMGEVSTRFACVNMDFDNIRAVDLMAVFASFVPVGGKILKISVYKSEFGKERMEREELEGPPREIFAKRREEEEVESDSEDEEESSEDEEELDEKIKKDLLKEDEGNEFDSAALRQYQLERLRYFYAVVVCSDDSTAKQIYDATDGREFLSSANYFDLRFIPDDTEFDEQPRDECDSVPSAYRPTEFVTDALQHSKVKLTWDAEDPSRKDVIKRAFTGSRAEIGENDLQAYLGSDSDDDDEDDEVAPVEATEGETTEAPKPTKKELARQKMRAALGLSTEPSASKPSKGGPVGDMEITFTPGLSAKERGNVFQNEPIIEETTAEAYVRKEKERKKRRKERAKARREGRDPDAIAPADAEDKDADEAQVEDTDLGFDDPFFADDAATKEKAVKTLRKDERLKKRAAKAAEAEAAASQRAELELLMVPDQDLAGDDGATKLDHFNMDEILRAEKEQRKGSKSKKHRKDKLAAEGGKRGGLQDGFEMDVDDPRFSAVFENHEFAIDPSNPRFKPTAGMKKLLEEGRRKRKIGDDEDDVGGDGARIKSGAAKKRNPDSGDGAKKMSKDDLSSLVESVKKKAKK